MLATGQLTQVKREFCSERASHGEARPRQQMSDEFESANQLCGIIKKTCKLKSINALYVLNHTRELIAGPADVTSGNDAGTAGVSFNTRVPYKQRKAAMKN